MASAQDLQPTCEDYDSDQSEGHVEYPGRPSPSAANVSTKRSQASDLNKERASAPNDLRSDSGYSSYTAATVSSTNSAQSASSQCSPPAAPSPPAPAAAAVAAHPQAPPPPPPQPQHQPPAPPKPSRRLTQSDQSRPKLSSRTTSQSSAKPVVKQRRPTVTQDARPERTRRDSRVDSECTDPNCTSCPPTAIPARLARPGIKPTQSARDVDRLSADTRSMRSDPATYHPSPPSPNQARRPAAYRQESAIIQPAKAPRRPSTSRQRPMSYGGEPNPQYWAPGSMPAPYPSPPQEHGPPLSNSAGWRNMPQYHAGGMPPYGVPQGYPAPYYTHTPPPFDGPQRPGMPVRMNSARNGPAPLVTQIPRDQQYSTRYNQPQSAVQARFPQQIHDQTYESESESETGSSEDDDEYYNQPDPNDPRNQRALMAPPKLERTKSKSTSKKQQRPPIRHANTTQVFDERAARRMSLSQAQPQSLVIEEPRRKRTTRTSEEPSRRASVSRPAPPRHAQSDYPDHRGQMVVAKSIKAERRRSGQVYEQVYHPDDRRAAERSEAAAKKARALARAEAKRAEEAQRAEEARYQAEQAEIERKRANRNSKQYYREPPEFYSDSESEESDEEPFLPEAPAPPPPQARRRRPTDAGNGNGKGKERVLERKTKRIENEAEEYISARRGAREPLNDPIHNAARHSRTISMPSHSGSSGSERSRSNRTAITNENNEIRLRVDANAPLSLQFNGDMEGRTLRMIPAENGMADLVISGGRETAYHNSDRGSNADDRKALALRQPRRQAEEMTESSSRSRKRRDSQVIRETRVERSGGQRPLRQRAHTSSYYNE